MKIREIFVSVLLLELRSFQRLLYRFLETFTFVGFSVVIVVR